ncbi:hypothetical protein VTN77DRAFT_2504 [Rasamsonia byssochlamydoides]|uniref:uncharacterized protein n=1 Tax=Rasamsonia byssochlamydoides TaxID=89139 RepID=UPI00374314FB
MPPNKKKKKPASNPARGFATVSVPSKPKITESAGVSSTGESSVAVSESEKSTLSVETKQPQAEEKDKSLQNYSPEELERHLEEAELQSLVEKYASKCKSDADRQVSKLETERRLLRPQASLLNLTDWLPPEILDRILELTGREDAEREPFSERDMNSAKEEELSIRLWTLKDTLLKLGFPDSRVEELLKYIIIYHSGVPASGNKDVAWNIDESLDWLALHCNPDELPPYEKTKTQPSKTMDTTTSWITDDRQSQPSTTPSLAESNDSLKKARSETTVVSAPSPSPDDSDSSIDPEDFTEEYVALQSQLYQLRPQYFDQPSKAKNKKPGRDKSNDNDTDPRVARIRRKIAKIENDVLFDHVEAEVKWRDKLNELRKEAAFMREKERQVEKPPSSSRIENPQPVEEPDSGELGLAADDDNGALFGEMFAADTSETEPLPIAESTSHDILIRDFGKPSGLSPRRVLEETCKARDPASKIIFRDISSSTYSNRKAVEVQWSKPQEVPFPLSLDRVTFKSNPFTIFVSMDSIATPTAVQAEGYISTLCLFLVSASSSKESKSYMRLPAAWRELWTEFAETKKQQEDEADRETIRGLKRLVQENVGKFEDDVVLADNFRKRNGNAKQIESMERAQPADDCVSADNLTKIWLDKASSAEFQRMVSSRMNLPVWGYKQEILDTLATNQALIICSETGSGKSTQIPSFILENELLNGRQCKIYVTEPRRISAISLARRVSEELGERNGDVGTNRSLVGYAIRLESKVSQSTRLIYATTGVVVRMLERPSDFQDITHIVLDEVHERTIDSDFLLIVLRRLLVQRPELKVVLMSATVDARRFSTYLGGAPILNIPGRTFPVEVKYLEDAIELTNHRLDDRQSFSSLDDDDDGYSSDGPRNDDVARGLRATLDGYSSQTRETVLKFDEYRLDYRLITKLLARIATKPELSQYSRAILVFMPGLAEIRRLHDEIAADSTFDHGWIIHTLHSSIASEDQEKAFLVPPEGMRKIVIATNIAETGITIPDITAVIDAGKEKVMRFDERRQLSRLVESFISRANAKQRRGRAGRVQKGICFHLFTKYRYDNQLAEQQTPEMLRLSLQDLVLRVKICNLGDVEQTLLEALDPPSAKNIRRAIDSLKEVKALTNTENLTSLGKQLAKLPLDVFLGKLIIYGTIFKCLDACVSIAAILSSKSPFVNTMGSNTQRDLARLSFRKGDSDLLTVYNAYTAWKRIKNTPGANEYAFCRKNFLSPQTLLNIEDIKTQLLVSIVDAGLLKLDAEEQASLRRARVTGRQRQFFTVPERVDLNSSNDLIVNSVIAWSFYPKLLIREGKGWRNVANNQNVTLHPTSVNKQSESPLKWLSFYHIMQARSKFYNAHETSAVEDFAVALLCGDPDFKMYSGVISIDNNRIRFAVRDWKQILAFKTFNLRVRDILSDVIRNPQKNLSHRQREWLNIWQQIFTFTRSGNDRR